MTKKVTKGSEEPQKPRKWQVRHKGGAYQVGVKWQNCFLKAEGFKANKRI
jgi:hypothetical protein